MSKLIDRTGEVVRKRKIIEELGKDRIKAQCIGCGDIKNYRKAHFIAGSYSECDCFRDKSLGLVKGNLKIIEDNKGSKYKLKCQLCNREFYRYKEGFDRSANPKCSCERNTEGKTYNNLKILKELGKGRIKAECLLCGNIKEFRKTHVVNGVTKACGCQMGRRPNKNIEK